MEPLNQNLWWFLYPGVAHQRIHSLEEEAQPLVSSCLVSFWGLFLGYIKNQIHIMGEFCQGSASPASKFFPLEQQLNQSSALAALGKKRMRKGILEGDLGGGRACFIPWRFWSHAKPLDSRSTVEMITEAACKPKWTFKIWIFYHPHGHSSI